MLILKRIGFVLTAVFVSALASEPKAEALTCASPPWGEEVYLQLEEVREDGVQVSPQGYDGTAYLDVGGANFSSVRFVVYRGEQTSEQFFQ